MKTSEPGRWSPVVSGTVGIIVGGSALYYGWTSQVPIAQWHHGLVMIMLAGLMFGYSIGARTLERAEGERRAAEELATKFCVQRDELRRALDRRLSKEEQDADQADGNEQLPAGREPAAR